MNSTSITVIGGGLAGLVAAITAAEQHPDVALYEAHRVLGGRARTTAGPYRANLGPHVVYADGAMWQWLAARDLVGPFSNAPAHGLRFRHRGRSRSTPPIAFVRTLMVVRRAAPVDLSFREWATAQLGDDAAEVACAAAGVFSFTADPGSLSAAFVQERLRRAFSIPSVARWVHGGWGAIVRRLERRARELGVRIHLSSPVDALPGGGPVIVATELPTAARLLGDDTLCWPSASVACLDVGLENRRGDAFLISDLDDAGWVERFSVPDPSVAPAGHGLVQAQIGRQGGESLDDAVARLEALVELGFPGFRERETWRRRYALVGRSGALDPPGATWRDRPAIDHGDGVYLAGDAVAAPGLLSEVACTSGVWAAEAALRDARRVGTGSARGVRAT